MRARRRTLPMLVTLAAALSACGGDDRGPQQLTVLSRNLYLGADLTPALVAQDPALLVQAASAIWDMVNKNDFTDRARAIAAEIAATQPDLVGLQEVSLWRTQSPGDGAIGGTTPATTVAFDFLEILRAELSARGLGYSPAHVLELSDIEVPILTGIDVRLTDRDVILVRDGVTVSNAEGHVFTVLLPITLNGVIVPVRRGWARVDVNLGGQPIAFVNTHLEAASDVVRTAQGLELVQALASETGRIVFVGDLNSAPGTEAHLAATNGGFADAWTATHGAEPGLTCCWPEDLSLTAPGLTSRIDLVLTRGAVHPLSVTLLGEELADRTPAGRWPSDHVGVVAAIEVD